MSGLSNSKLDANKAKAIALRFLGQSFSTVTISSLFFDRGVWRVSTNVGMAKEHIIEVTIDPKTGKILSCWHAARLKKQID